MALAPRILFLDSVYEVKSWMFNLRRPVEHFHRTNHYVNPNNSFLSLKPKTYNAVKKQSKVVTINTIRTGTKQRVEN